MRSLIKLKEKVITWSLNNVIWLAPYCWCVFERSLWEN